MTSKLTLPPTHTIEDIQEEDTSDEEEVKASKTNKLISAYVENPCSVCRTCLSSACALRKHMENVHNIKLPARVASKVRPRSIKYQFVSKKSQPHRRTLFGCPSCWFHCKQDFERMEIHMFEAHLDEIAPGFEDPEDEGDFDISDDEKEVAFKDSYSAGSYMVAQLDDLSSKFKTLLGFV